MSAIKFNIGDTIDHPEIDRQRDYILSNWRSIASRSYVALWYEVNYLIEQYCGALARPNAIQLGSNPSVLSMLRLVARMQAPKTEVTQMVPTGAIFTKRETFKACEWWLHNRRAAVMGGAA